MRSQNRHDTVKWKRKRKTHGADKCGNAKCTICHPYKVMGVEKVRDKKEKLKGKD
jgi:hypothetical protein